MLRKLFITFLIVMLAIASFTPVANASVYLGTAEIDCTSVDMMGSGAHTLNRNTSGTGQETIRIEVTDGSGTMLFSLSYSNTLQTYAGGIGDFTYTVPPTTNPITVRVISPAGNGHPEQIDFFAQGECVGLPYLTPPAPPCPNPQPSGFTIRNIPFSTPAYFAADEGSSTGFEIPSGNWYVGAAEDGFVEVWIACEARNIFVPVSAVH